MLWLYISEPRLPALLGGWKLAQFSVDNQWNVTFMRRAPFFLCFFPLWGKTNNLQPWICGRSVVRWRAMPSERENHFSSRLTCNLSFLSSFHCVFLSRLFCQSVCSLFYFPGLDILFYLVSSPILCYDFFYFFLFQGLMYLQTWQKDPLWNVLYRILWFEQEVEWCHWQGRVVLRDFKLKLVFFHASAALWASVLCTTCHVLKTSITRVEKHTCTDTRRPLGLGDFILNSHYIFARNYFDVLFKSD